VEGLAADIECRYLAPRQLDLPGLTRLRVLDPELLLPVSTGLDRGVEPHLGLAVDLVDVGRAIGRDHRGFLGELDPGGADLGTVCAFADEPVPVALTGFEPVNGETGDRGTAVGRSGRGSLHHGVA